MHNFVEIIVLYKDLVYLTKAGSTKNNDGIYIYIYTHSNSPYPGSLGPSSARNSETAISGNILHILQC